MCFWTPCYSVAVSPLPCRAIDVLFPAVSGVGCLVKGNQNGQGSRPNGAPGVEICCPQADWPNGYVLLDALLQCRSVAVAVSCHRRFVSCRKWCRLPCERQSKRSRKQAKRSAGRRDMLPAGRLAERVCASGRLVTVSQCRRCRVVPSTFCFLP